MARKARKKADAPKLTPIYAVGTASGAHRTAPDLARRIEEAASKAVTDALADGVSITDSDELKRRKLKAMAEVDRG